MKIKKHLHLRVNSKESKLQVWVDKTRTTKGQYQDWPMEAFRGQLIDIYHRIVNVPLQNTTKTMEQMEWKLVFRQPASQGAPLLIHTTGGAWLATAADDDRESGTITLALISGSMSELIVFNRLLNQQYSAEDILEVSVYKNSANKTQVKITNVTTGERLDYKFGKFDEQAKTYKGIPASREISINGMTFLDHSARRAFFQNAIETQLYPALFGRTWKQGEQAREARKAARNSEDSANATELDEANAEEFAQHLRTSDAAAPKADHNTRFAEWMGSRTPAEFPTAVADARRGAGVLDPALAVSVLKANAERCGYTLKETSDQWWQAVPKQTTPTAPSRSMGDIIKALRWSVGALSAKRLVETQAQILNRILTAYKGDDQKAMLAALGEECEKKGCQLFQRADGAWAILENDCPL